MSHCVVPDVALGSEIGVGLAAHDQRRPPLDELEEGAEGEAGGTHQVEQPAAALQRGFAQQQFARQDRRDESLREMPEPVVVVAREVEGVAEPVAERRHGIGVLAAVDQDDAVDRDQPQQQAGEVEAPAQRHDQRHADQHPDHLHEPGQAVGGGDARPEQHAADHGQQEGAFGARNGGDVHGAKHTRPRRDYDADPAV
jgi:hypothetical protein